MPALLVKPYQRHTPSSSSFLTARSIFASRIRRAEDWARDHATAARVGMNMFRHWFLWGAIEVAPGKYDWSDYDQMMDLAAENGLKVIIAEFTTARRSGRFAGIADARYKASDGTVVKQQISESSATGGFPGLCLDNPEAHAAAETFLAALIERYRSHPALLGYDLWNENTSLWRKPRKMNCYCEGTKQKLGQWLRSDTARCGSWARHGGAIALKRGRTLSRRGHSRDMRRAGLA